MLQQTLTRIEALAQTSPIIVCNEEHRFLVAEQVRQLGLTSPTIILEPEGKNTAPAIALAAIAASASDSEVNLLVLPADHYVGKPTALIDAIEKAASAASQGKLVTFGLVPSHPETGYGYIRRGRALAIDVSVLERFVEKPDQPTAEGYIASGDYVWNSGMFMFTAGQFLVSLAKFQPKMAQVCQRAMEQAERDMDFIRPDAEVFTACPSDSIMLSWNIRRTAQLSRLIAIGAILGPGLHFGKLVIKIPRETSPTVTWCLIRPRTVTSAVSRVW